MRFINSYAHLPEPFYQRIDPEPVAAPSLIRLNRPLAERLELDLPEDDADLAALFSGNRLLPGSEPIAQAYAGHQFGQFVPQLGDGRAHLLGETVNKAGERFDIQLKGSGRTKFSRGGDGRSPLGPVLREYVVSEAMHAMGIPSTRALAMTSTGQPVFREAELHGAVLTRVASGFVRVGTFEYFAARRMEDAVRQLADHVIERNHPSASQADNPYLALFEAICSAQAELMARWMCVGFVHGVMNTDNTAVSGETIDFGPCAFLDQYDPEAVFSSIDHFGRYAFNRQPTIMAWNLACLGGCLIPLLDDDESRAHTAGEAVLERFIPAFAAHYTQGLCSKIGLPGDDESFALARGLLDLMRRNGTDFTNAFRALCDAQTDPAPFTALFATNEEIRHWLDDWRARLALTGSVGTARETMRSATPAFIPRNHRIEQAIQAAEVGDFTLVDRLIEVLRRPYEDQPENAEYAAPPRPEERVEQTFCGT
ncbi:YdiU family protein [Pseudodesulfovibrio thermohalotolerans]|uniref:protein adenylyltransferase SelO n=1 Tax=Pseudodesulfovibrio thermohalotolerans TaxID=2880651 RepID=UPI00244263E1|nr:YdiU family protein [Pseudodesulfovibrio thermohalotolerans]WFS62560.1 YdiU family protein [Pseudodesulfovibrio thermohalotolerans]